MVSALVSANFQVYFTHNFQVLFYTALYYTGERTSIHKAARGHRRHTSQPSTPNQPRLWAGTNCSTKQKQKKLVLWMSLARQTNQDFELVWFYLLFACLLVSLFVLHSIARRTPYRHPTDTLQTHSVADELRLWARMKFSKVLCIVALRSKYMI